MPQSAISQILLDEWRRELDRCYEGTAQHPITVKLAQSLQQFPIPKEHFEELIAGVEMDLTHARYPTFRELYEYCYRVAGVVGLMCIEIFGYRNPKAKDYAVNLGVALQLTNIIRDLKGDAERGRIYLPQDELARFGYREEELLRGAYTPAFSDAHAALPGVVPGNTLIMHDYCWQRKIGAHWSRQRSWERFIIDSWRGSKRRTIGCSIAPLRLPTSHKLWIALSIWMRSIGTAVRR